MRNLNCKDFERKLTEKGFIDLKRMAEINNAMKLSGKSFFECIRELEAEGMPEFLKEHFGIETITRSTVPEENALKYIPQELVRKYRFIPLKISEGSIYIAFADPFLTKMHEMLEQNLSENIVAYFIKQGDIDYFLNNYYPSSRKINAKESEKVSVEVENAPAARAINHMLDIAVMKSASDIHIEPLDTYARVRYRIDGILIELSRLDITLLPNVISRLKIMSGMDSYEKRLPQDGHFESTVNNIKIDFRTSTVLTVFGEKAVIRLIYERHDIKDKFRLGFYGEDLEKISYLINSPNGAVLLTGPTGSGKTTTMAAILRDLNHEEKNIITIEDPVENIIPGINQININPKAGLTFATALRSILRQDPDIIMVGEIRDPETASVAVRSAVTGHLVLSTLHTNDALGAVYRLIDMEVNDYLVYAGLRGVISQRLVRELCPNCKKAAVISDKERLLTGLSEGTAVFSSSGCEHCSNTGYKGRFAIYEILIIDDELISMFQKGIERSKITLHLREKGMKSIWDCGINAFKAGKTTSEEILRAVYNNGTVINDRNYTRAGSYAYL